MKSDDKHKWVKDVKCKAPDKWHDKHTCKSCGCERHFYYVAGIIVFFISAICKFILNDLTALIGIRKT